jgi:hypothetical protein
VEGCDAPPLDSVRERVRFDWMAQKEESLLEQRVLELRRRYSVRFSGGGSKP